MFKPLKISIFAFLMVLNVSEIAAICKWVDKAGAVHYAEVCPETVDSTDVKIEGPPPEQQVSAAVERSEALSRQRRLQITPASKSVRFRSLPLDELGPLPVNSTSSYLVTKLALYKMDAKKRLGQFFLSLQAKDNLPPGAFLEAYFPNPANPERHQIVSKLIKEKGGSVTLLSRASDGFKCWNYEISVLIYKDESRTELLDTHRQVIQSQIDLSLIKSSKALARAMAVGACPSAYQHDMEDMTVEQLDALCEREREKHLKKERTKLVETCKKRGNKQPEWCENYYADWGDARRLDINTLVPALYYDLPECIAAKRARDKER